MDSFDVFDTAIARTLEHDIPAPLQSKIKNVAFIIEDEPSDELRAGEGLSEDETLLGYYHGIPLTERGESYGIGTVYPDTISIYRLPILEEAEVRGIDVETIIRETVLHEVAHYFGMNEDEVRAWERRDRVPHAQMPGGHVR